MFSKMGRFSLMSPHQDLNPLAVEYKTKSQIQSCYSQSSSGHTTIKSKGHQLTSIEANGTKGKEKKNTYTKA